MNTIIEGLKKGDKKTYRYIFKEYYGMLYNLCYQYIGDENYSKDIVQNTFMKLWESRKSIKDNSNIKNYLYTITKNESLNYLSKQIIVAEDLESGTLSEIKFNFSSLSKMDADYMEFEELKDIIWNSVAKLSKSTRDVFIKSRFEGLTNKEISDQTGLAVKTIESHITKSLKHLKIELVEYLSLAFFIRYII